MSIRNKPHFAELKIVAYSKKGNGVGQYTRQDGSSWPVEVSFTVPGDIVKVQLLRKRSGIYQSYLLEFVKQSEIRILPKCKHFAICGGCRWQQISYDCQLKNKQKYVLKYFKNLITKDVEIKEIIPCEKRWYYRNKMDFSFSSDSSDNFYLGLVKDSSKGKVFNLLECHLCESWFVSCIAATRKWAEEMKLDAYHAKKETGSLKILTLREGVNTGDRMVNLHVSGNPKFALKKHHIESFKAFIREAIEPLNPGKKLSIFLTIQQTALGKPTQFFEMHLYGSEYVREILTIRTDPDSEPAPLLFYISPSSFFQPNSWQAKNLYYQALKMALIPKSAIVYDLYSGTGTLGIIAAGRARQVIGIEMIRQATIDAKLNAKENKIDNITFLTGSVPDILHQIKKEDLFPPPDIVMVDPPRAGLDSHAIDEILKLNPNKILYVSCNPKSQAENILEFVKKDYKLHSIQPVDQFPHTAHIENIVLLTRK